MQRQLLLLLYLLLLAILISCKSISRQERDIHAALMTQPSSNRQIGGGLSALGTLVSPLLFLMGMGSFISMLPQMFQTVLSGVGSNLIQSFTGGGAAAAGGSPSFRVKRSAVGPELLEDDLLDELARRINMAVLQYERPEN